MALCPFGAYVQVPAICRCHHQQWHTRKQNLRMPSCNRDLKRLFLAGIEALCDAAFCSLIVRVENNQNVVCTGILYAVVVSWIEVFWSLAPFCCTAGEEASQPADTQQVSCSGLALGKVNFGIVEFSPAATCRRLLLGPISCCGICQLTGQVCAASHTHQEF